MPIGYVICSCTAIIVIAHWIVQGIIRGKLINIAPYYAVAVGQVICIILTELGVINIEL